MNGDAIYGTIPWKYQNDTQTAGVWYTANAQSSNDRETIYAIILQYPYTDSEDISLFALDGLFDDQTKVNLLGYPEDLHVTIQDFIIEICDDEQFFFF